VADPAATALTGAAMAARRDQRNEQEESARLGLPATPRAMSARERKNGWELRRGRFVIAGEAAALPRVHPRSSMESTPMFLRRQQLEGGRRGGVCYADASLGRPFAALSSPVWSIMGDLSRCKRGRAAFPCLSRA
jgi:hypothetical protein